MKNVLKTQAKSVLIATDAAINKRMFGAGPQSDLALPTTT